MSVKLTNHSDDIAPLSRFELLLEDLTVLTGVNGSGKTRLLNSIKNGQIQAEIGNNIIPASQIDIISNPGSLIPFNGSNPQDYTFQALNRNLNQAYSSNFNKQLKNYEQTITQKVKVEKLVDYSKFASKDHASKEIEYAQKLIHKQLISHYVNGKIDERNDAQFKILIQRIDQLVQHLQSNNFSVSNSDIPYLAIGHSLARNGAIPKMQIAVPQSYALLQAFENWRREYAKNAYQRYRVSINRVGAFAHNDEEFYKIHGPKPWELLNKLLANIGSKLKFHVDEELMEEEATSFRSLDLRDNKGTVFPAEGVSKGERIIFLIVLRRYAKSSTHIKYNNPSILLLDELDAHLHLSLIHI